MKRTFFIAGLVVISLLLYAAPTQAFETRPIGWASVADTNGTPYDVNGGEGGTVVTVTDDANFIYYAQTLGSSQKYIILVAGRIILPGTSHSVNVKSNRSVIGIGRDPCIFGSLNISSNYSNIIIRNLNISYEDANQGCDDPDNDGITIQNGAHNIWVDHCTIYDSPDGLLDPTKHSDYITISWCKFFYTPTSENTCHRFTNLVGSDDSDPCDPGKLKDTFHHNWWGSGCKERMPRVRRGKVHVFNNYYSNLLSGGYCIGVGNDCNVRVENNYFHTVPMPWKDYGSTGHKGRIGWNTGNVFYSCSVPTWAPNDYNTMFVPPYSYTLDAGSNVPTIVQNGAGVNKLNPIPNPMTFSVTPYGLDSHSIAMTATTATCADGVQYFFHCTTPGGHDSAWQDSASYTDTNLAPDTNYTYTVQARNKLQPLFTGAASAPATGTTQADTTPPSPNPMTWATEPNATGIDTIAMTATTASDESGVEYYFANVTDPNHNSTWQDSTTYTDTGLTNNTTYTYKVKTRDKSSGHNETGWSDEASATTPRYVCTSPIVSDFDDNCQVDFFDYFILADEWTGDWFELLDFAEDWLTCNRDPSSECWQ